MAVVLATPAELAEAYQRFKSWAAIDKFFGRTLPTAVKRFHKAILVAALALAVMGFASTAAELKADDEPPRFFHRSHNLGLVYELSEDYFAAGAERGLSSAGGVVNVDVEAPTPGPTPRPAAAPYRADAVATTTPYPSVKPTRAPPQAHARADAQPTPGTTHGGARLRADAKADAAPHAAALFRAGAHDARRARRPAADGRADNPNGRTILQRRGHELLRRRRRH